MCCQCSATELQPAGNHQPSYSSPCTAQVVLNSSVSHLAAMCCQLCSIPTDCRLFAFFSFTSKQTTCLYFPAEFKNNAQSILPHAGNKCYEAKIEESEKAGSRTQDTSGLSHQCSATELRQPDNHHLTILYMYCTGGTECLSRTPGSHSVCAVRTPLGVDRKILSIRKEPMLSGFLTLNAQSILPHAGNK